MTLGVAAAAATLSRQAYLDAEKWVTHTNEVKLELAAARLAVARNDGAALRASEDRVEALTVDNPIQQRNIGRAKVLTELGVDASLDELLSNMDHEEDRLMAERTRSVDVAQRSSGAASISAFVLALALLVAAKLLHRRQRAKLARQGRMIEAVVDGVDEGIIAVDVDGGTIALNSAARTMVGQRASLLEYDVVGSSPSIAMAFHEDGRPLARDEEPLALALRGRTTADFVYRIVRADEADGETWVSASARPVRDDTGAIVAAVTTLRDITQERSETEFLRTLSFKDELTGLYNRRGFIESAKKKIETARLAHVPVAILFADLDGLKRINDGLGHEEGDRAIKDAANVLRTCFRHDEIIGRLGGDEFVVFLPNIDQGTSEVMLDRISRAAADASERYSRLYRLSISAGVSFMDTAAGQSIEELLVVADQQMYTRKRTAAALRGNGPPSLRQRGTAAA